MGEERKVILHIATSKDGFIATLDDGLDWLPGPTGDEDYGLGEFMETIDCVLIGRRTWDVISQFEEEPFSNFERHILSRKTHSAVDLIHDLKIKSGEHIWLLGGGVLNGECLQAEVIDEIIGSFFAGLAGICGGPTFLCCGLIFLLIGIVTAFTQKGEEKTETRIEINQEIDSVKGDKNWYDDGSS